MQMKLLLWRIILLTTALSRYDRLYKHHNNTMFTILMGMLVTNQHFSLFFSISNLIIENSLSYMIQVYMNFPPRSKSIKVVG